MDVTCERCKTEYDFDDTLVSGRGTTVKCTNCGFQFKVKRQETSLPEKWVVRTVDGREIEFSMLRDLQTAIAQAKVSRDDVLSRGTTRPRRLGSIAELEPFFGPSGGMLVAAPTQGLGISLPRGRKRTLTPVGLGPVEDSTATTLPTSIHDAETEPLSDSDTVVMRGHSFDKEMASSAEELEREPIVPGELAVTRPYDTQLLPGVVVSPEEAPPLPDAVAQRQPGADATPENESPAPPPVKPAPQPPSTPTPAKQEQEAASSKREVPSRPIATRKPISTMPPPMTPSPGGDVRASYYLDDAYGEPRFSAMVPSKRLGAARWIVGFVVAGLAALAVVTLGPRYLTPRAQGPAQASDNERITTLLTESEQSLGEGDLETARDKLLKASALAENNPRVAANLARLETATADLRWLRVQLLADDDPDMEPAKHDLKTGIERAKKAVNDAHKLAPEDTLVTRCQIDLLRIEGNLAEARKHVSAISANSAQPENALTLAALDLAEAQPSWPAVIERLRTAVSGEQSLRRGRALLIYALVRSDDIAGAKAEQERLSAMPRPHPLVGALRAFIERAEKTNAAESKNDKDAGTKAPPSVSTTNLPSTPSTAKRPWDPGTSSDGRVPDDYVFPGQGAEPPSTPQPAPSAKPSATPPPTTTAEPPPVDTSDLPGVQPTP